MFKIFNITIKKHKQAPEKVNNGRRYIFSVQCCVSVVSELNNGPRCITWPPPKCFVKQEVAQEGKALQGLSAAE